MYLFEVAANFQLANYVFKTEADYLVSNVRDGQNHTINYVIQVPKHEFQGTTQLIKKADEWQVAAALRSPLFPTNIVFSSYYKNFSAQDELKIQAGIPLFRVPINQGLSVLIYRLFYISTTLFISNKKATHNQDFNKTIIDIHLKAYLKFLTQTLPLNWTI